MDLDVDLVDRRLAANVRAPLLLCKFALSAMLARKSGSIVGITSGAARAYRQGRAVYSSTKASLERMLLSLAEEVRADGVAVNALSPGRVDTWMNRHGAWPGTDHIPMVPPDAVAPAVVWLRRSAPPRSPASSSSAPSSASPGGRAPERRRTEGRPRTG